MAMRQRDPGISKRQTDSYKYYKYYLGAKNSLFSQNT